MVCFPSEPGFGVYVTEHEPDASAQLLLAKVPEELEEKLKVPVGVIGVPVPESVAFAVQVTGALTGSVPGEQLTVVVDGR